MSATSCMGVLALTLVIAGCASSNVPEAASDAGGDASVKPPIDAHDAGSVGQLGDPCERARQCRGELICEPEQAVCADPGPCDEHAECGLGGHCAAGGVCAASGGHAPCASDDDCAFGDSCVGGTCGCRGELVEAELRDVNMLIVLDRSGSMWEDTDGMHNGPWENTKWYLAMSAIDRLLASTAGPVNYGLVLFPHAEAVECTGCDQAPACRPGNTLVDVGAGTSDEIREQLAATLPACCTPTGDTLDAYLGYEGLADPDADNYILLIADGFETCGGDAVSAAGSLKRQDPPVRTFAVGFGGAVDPEELSGIAKAGGTVREGDRGYYQADDQDQLERAFADIAVEALSCVHSVEGRALDTGRLKVHLDGEALPRDPAREDGWDYDAERNELSFHGPVCKALQTGAVGQLSYAQTCDLVID